MVLSDLPAHFDHRSLPRAYAHLSLLIAPFCPPVMSREQIEAFLNLYTLFFLCGARTSR